jgi:ABC-2 type transport system permease protein
MPIFDQGYQHWQGTLHSRFWTWWAIARRGAVQASKNRFTRLVLIGSLMPSLALATILALWGLVEQQVSWAELFLKTFNLPETIFSDRARLRNLVWTFAFHYFSIFEFMAAMILVLLAGPELISQDLRFNAIPLYFSKPLRRLDYFVGKLGVIGLLLSVVVFAPMIVAYILGVAFSLDVKVVKDTFPVLLGGLAYGAVIVVSAGMLMLAVSSLSRNTRTVGAIWIGAIIVLNSIAGITNQISKDDRALAISYTGNLTRVGRELLGVPHAADQLLDLQEELTQQAQRVAGQKTGSFGLPIPGPPTPPTPSEKRKRREDRGPRVADPQLRQQQEFGPLRYFRQLADDPHPLGLAVGVLAGLFAVSLFVLSSRVKSLDRLK